MSTQKSPTFFDDFAAQGCQRLLSRVVASGRLTCWGHAGKSFQVITFLHTLYSLPKGTLAVEEEGSRVLLVAPKNVLINWEDEFKKWLSHVPAGVMSVSKVMNVQPLSLAALAHCGHLEVFSMALLSISWHAELCWAV